MSQTVDANVLTYAVNEDAVEHPTALALVEQLGRGPEIVYLFWPTVMAFLRIVTHPGVLPNPLPVRDAVETISALISQPHVRTPGEADGFWDLFIAAGGDRLGANNVPDLHVAALMRQHGVRLIHTRDRGYRRFDGVEVRDPFVSRP